MSIQLIMCCLFEAEIRCSGFCVLCSERILLSCPVLEIIFYCNFHFYSTKQIPFLFFTDFEPAAFEPLPRCFGI